MSSLGDGFRATLAQLAAATEAAPDTLRAEAEAHELWLGAVRVLAALHAEPLARLIKTMDRLVQEDEPIVILLACAVLSANVMRGSPPLPSPGFSAAVAEYAEMAIDALIRDRGGR